MAADEAGTLKSLKASLSLNFMRRHFQAFRKQTAEQPNSIFAGAESIGMAPLPG